MNMRRVALYASYLGYRAYGHCAAVAYSKAKHDQWFWDTHAGEV
jgi:hypothetical protein